MAVAADLYEELRYLANGTTDMVVRVGPETARVLETAARIWREHPGSQIYVMAGWSPAFRVNMGSIPMRKDLLRANVPESAIITAAGAEFTTDGEMIKLVESLQRLKLVESFEILLVCRWWHIPRARRLLSVRLLEAELDATTVPVPVASLDMIGMLREPLAWIKNWPQLKKSFS